MISTKRIFLIILLSFIFLTEAIASIKDSIAVTVGNRVITKSDILNEIKILLILNGQSYSDENKNQIQQLAVKQAVKRNIKQFEINKYQSLNYNPDDLQNELKKISIRLEVDLETLKKIFTDNGIDFSEVEEQLKTELLWNSLIFSLYKDKITINQNEIEEQLELIKAKQDIEEYLLSEIIIPPINKDKISSEIEKLKKRISVEGFAEVAKDISVSDTAISGGELGWISENVISDKFKLQIINTSVGNISEPIFLPKGIIIYKVRNKRKLEISKDLEEIKNQLVNSEKMKILNMYSLSHYDDLKRSLSINFHK